MVTKDGVSCDGNEIRYNSSGSLVMATYTVQLFKVSSRITLQNANVNGRQ
jgi:hypothetical protein